ANKYLFRDCQQNCKAGVKKLLVIAAGGVAGSLVRYLLVAKNDEIGIFLINLLGVTVAGLFALRLKPTELSRLFWIPGFAGAMTTFSSVAVIHGQRSDFEAIIYFYVMVIMSLLILWLINPRRELSK
ncbi:MAG: fluoride efflux transporter FluC, partial [Actinomycetota bacterium]